MSDDVQHEVAKYSAWMVDSDLPRTLYQGTKAMKLAGKKYLPANQLESDDVYKARLARSVLLNAFRKTSSFLAGQVFQADIVFDESVPEDFSDLKTNIDRSGNNINVFAKRVFQNGIGKGVSHILVDMDKVDEGATVEEKRQAGVRPYMREIRPEDVIGWLVEDGVLTQVRIRETTEQRDGKYGVKVVEQIRVLGQGYWELWELDGKTSAMVDNGTFPGNSLPFFTFIPGEEQSILTGETPLMDLAELNLAHWNSKSDQVNILHVGRVPILFGRHIDADKIPVGTSQMITSGDDNADMKFVEIAGASIAAGAADLEELKAEMALYGLQQLIPRTGSMTATEKALSSSESHSSLGTWATEFSDFLQSVCETVGVFGDFVFPEDGFTVNGEYNLGVADAATLTTILKAHDQGVLSAQGAFTELRRRGIVDEHLTWKDMTEDIEEENRIGDLAGTLFGGAPAT